MIERRYRPRSCTGDSGERRMHAYLAPRSSPPFVLDDELTSATIVWPKNVQPCLVPQEWNVLPRVRLGCCYYPEHWPEELLGRRCPANGRRSGYDTRPRIGEFAWSRIEPAAGQYNWGWLDRAIDILGTAGLGIILGTPYRHAAQMAGRRNARHAGPSDRHGRVRGFRIASPLLLQPHRLSRRGDADQFGRWASVTASILHLPCGKLTMNIGCHDTTFTVIRQRRCDGFRLVAGAAVQRASPR